MKASPPTAGMTWNKASTPGHESYTFPVIFNLIPQSPCRILDVGCGNGVLAEKIASLGHNVTGIEYSASGIEEARKRGSSVRFEVGSAYEIAKAVGDVKFDVILAVEVIEHLFSPAKFLSAVFDRLEPGGTLILTTPYHGYLKNLALSLFNRWDRHFSVDWEGGHIKFFSEASLTKLVREAGFQVISFHNTGRFPGLWKSLVLNARKPRTT